MAHEVEINGEPYLWKGIGEDKMHGLFANMDKIDGDPDNPEDVAQLCLALALYGLDADDLAEIIQEWQKYKRDKLSVFEEALVDLDM